MITLVEALNYRCLRYVQTPLKSFHVLVGPNASGKSTFLDVISFLSDLVSDGPDQAVMKRAPNPRDLLFRGEGDRFEMAVEAKIPDELRKLTASPDLDIIRYQVSIGFDNTKRQFEIKAETLLLKGSAESEPEKTTTLESSDVPKSLQLGFRSSGKQVIFNKVSCGNDNFYSEGYIPQVVSEWWPPRTPRKKSWSFKFGSRKSAFGNLPDNPDFFPVATWFRSYLTRGVQRFMPDISQIRRPSPPTRSSDLLLDGSNLPWVAARLRKEHPKKYDDWIGHLGTALPDLVDITTTERPEDRHCYIIYEYRGGHKVPSWLVSDGTLRITALTLPAYLGYFQGMYLIKEPENGIHPKDISSVYYSLSSLYDSQVFLVSHLLVLLNAVEAKELLFFVKDEEESTDIFSASDHPVLQHWNREIDIGTLYGMGILGEIKI